MEAGRVSLAGGLAELIFDTPLWLADNDGRVLCVIFSARATCLPARTRGRFKAPRRGKRKPDYLLAKPPTRQDDSAALAIHLERRRQPGFRLGASGLILSVCVSLLSNMVLSGPEPNH